MKCFERTRLVVMRRRRALAELVVASWHCGFSGALAQVARDVFLNHRPIQCIGLSNEGTGKGQEKPKNQLSGTASPTQPTSPQTGSFHQEFSW